MIAAVFLKLAVCDIEFLTSTAELQATLNTPF
jgi:hypothetical protein